jgi:hypothetical protein
MATVELSDKEIAFLIRAMDYLVFETTYKDKPVYWGISNNHAWNLHHRYESRDFLKTDLNVFETPLFDSVLELFDYLKTIVTEKYGH